MRLLRCGRLATAMQWGNAGLHCACPAGACGSRLDGPSRARFPFATLYRAARRRLPRTCARREYDCYGSGRFDDPFEVMIETSLLPGGVASPRGVALHPRLLSMSPSGSKTAQYKPSLSLQSARAARVAR